MRFISIIANPRPVAPTDSPIVYKSRTQNVSRKAQEGENRIANIYCTDSYILRCIQDDDGMTI